VVVCPDDPVGGETALLGLWTLFFGPALVLVTAFVAAIEIVVGRWLG
jgi:hypothetical protein